MDYLTTREREFEVDLEIGGTTSEEDRTEKSVSTDNKFTNEIINSFWSGHLSSNSSSNISKSGESSDDSLELLIGKNSEEECNEQVSILEKNCLEGKQKKTNPRKPPRPPRPPKGPSLDAADEKFVREIAEFAMRKRARIERIKALKKMRVSKVSKSNTTLSAMIITVIFCFIIIFQGLNSRSSVGVGMQGSPAPATGTSESIVSIQFIKNFSGYDGDEPASGSSILPE